MKIELPKNKLAQFNSNKALVSTYSIKLARKYQYNIAVGLFTLLKTGKNLTFILMVKVLTDSRKA